MRCPGCGFENPLGFKFCGKCGTSLIEQTQASKHTKEADRRQLTVMFCDLVGFTYLSEQIEPEELQDIVGAFQRGCTEVIYHFGGYIAQYLGDGLLVYFGYPFAHEDEVQRAVRAGLEIIREANELPLQSRLQRNIRVRIGIHTGLVMMGYIGVSEKLEQLALGDTPIIASRVQSLAEPDTVLISGATYRLAQGYFDCADMGVHELKGILTPVRVYRVLGERDRVSRFEVVANRGLTPFVGREKEPALLVGCWNRAKCGSGQVVLLSGEAGIGKSRLVQELKERIREEAYTLLESQCLPYYQNSAFYPIIDLVERIMEFEKGDLQEEKVKKLEDFLRRYDFSLSEIVPLFASLLSLSLSGNYPPINLTPQRQKEKTLEALLSYLEKEAERQPMLFVLEDLQWADPSTLEFLDLVVNRADKYRILTLLTFRPDFNPLQEGWTGRRTHLTNLSLSRLDRAETEVLVGRIMEDNTLPSELVEQIVLKSDGIPLYAEELTKTVMETGFLKKGDRGYEPTEALPQISIPATLQDSLMARLDRLSTVKEVAQIGATIGREFSYELLKSVSLLDETTLQKELNRLAEAELIYQRGVFPELTYIFKHALIRDAAYQSLLKNKRRQYHQKIAEILERRFQETVETQPELPAHHYTEAKLIEKAIPYWIKAGQRSAGRSANREAISHINKGLELLKTLPETPEGIQQELALQTTLGGALTAARGYGDPEVEKPFIRAKELCEKLGDTPQLFPVLLGLAHFYTFRDWKIGSELVNRLFDIAESSKDSSFFIWCYGFKGATLYWEGKPSPSLEYFDRAISLYKFHGPCNRFMFFDPVVASLGYKAVVLWTLGYPDQGSKILPEAKALAEKLPHPASLIVFLSFFVFFQLYCRNVQLTKEGSEALIEHSTEFGFPLHKNWGKVLLDWALVEQREIELRIEEMLQGLDSIRNSGEGALLSCLAVPLAEACWKLGHVKAGLNLVDEQLDNIKKRGLLLFEPELNRVKGKLMMALSDEGQAEACFYHAIEVACRQKAKSFELRAVMELSRLLKKQEKAEEARQMLSKIYNWFTEGFDTGDLIEAKALLNDLS